MKLVGAFSADEGRSKINFAEFSTMMHYLAEAAELSAVYEGDGGEAADVDKRVVTAIKMYERDVEKDKKRIAEKLASVNSILKMKDVEIDDDAADEPNPMDTDFKSAWGPNQMRCLALVSHNGMKQTSKFKCPSTLGDDDFITTFATRYCGADSFSRTISFDSVQLR